MYAMVQFSHSGTSSTRHELVRIKLSRQPGQRAVELSSCAWFFVQLQRVDADANTAWLQVAALVPIEQRQFNLEALLRMDSMYNDEQKDHGVL